MSSKYQQFFDDFCQHCLDGDVATVTRLLPKVKSLKALDSEGAPPLVCAAASKSVELVAHLLDNGADVNQRCDERFRISTALVEAAKVDDNAAIIRLLVSRGAEIDAACDDGVTALGVACANNRLSNARVLLDLGASVDGGFPLHCAAFVGLLQCCEMLVERGANIDKRGSGSLTALMIASQKGHVDVVRILISSGADQTIADKEGARALDHAVLFNHADTVRVLLTVCADITAICKPFIAGSAIAVDSFDCVPLLIAAGADVNAVTDDGFTALMFACEKLHAPTVALLLTAGANHAAANNEGKTAMQFTDNIACQVLLVGAGATGCPRTFTGDQIDKARSKIDEARQRTAQLRVELEVERENWRLNQKPTRLPQLAPHCHVCNQLTSQKCSGCRRQYYCSADCQKADWPQHKAQCKQWRATAIGAQSD